MKAKHQYIARDSALLKMIYQQVEQKLAINKNTFQPAVLGKFIIYFFLFVCFYSSLYTVSNPSLFICCFIGYGFSTILLAFNFSHDFSHNTVFSSKKLNNCCFICLYSIVGAHAEAWKQRHINSHHYAPNVENFDSDLSISKLIRVIPNSKHNWYNRYQYIYAPLVYTTYSLFWIFIKDFIILFSDDDFKKNKDFKYHLSFWAQKVFYITFIFLLPLSLSRQTLSTVFTGFILMHLSQSLFLLLTFFMTHHVEETEYPSTDKNGNIETSWLMNQIKSSNDMHPFSETANFVLGGFNNHIAHHLFPHIHHIYYPKLNKILYDILIRHGIKPNQTTYFGGIISHMKLLKRMSYNGDRIGKRQTW